MTEPDPSMQPQLITRSLKIILPIAILGLAATGFVLLKATRAVTPPVALQEKSWQVRTVTVNPERHTPNVLLYGTVEAPHAAALKAAITADVVQVAVREGQTVSAGDVLVKLDERDITLNLRQREADIIEIKAQIDSEMAHHAANRAALKRELTLLALAKRAVVRTQNLNRKQLLSESAMDDARRAVEQQALAVNTRQLAVDDHQARLAQLEARHLRAKALRDQAQINRNRTQMTAPFDGRIATVSVSVGDRVRVGDSLLKLYPVTGLEVRAQIPFRYLPVLRTALSSGQPLSATAKVDGRTLHMVMDRLGGETGEQDGGLDALFKLFKTETADNPLTPGRVLSLLLDLPPIDNVVSLPFEALYGLERIYRLDQDRMKALSVQRIGERREPDGTRQVLVRSAKLSAGDRIITTQLPNAMTGLKVSVVE